MIQGVIASQIEPAESGFVIPAGSLLFLDFLNGHYAVGETVTTAAAVVDAPAKIVPGSGLEILLATETTEGSGVANIIGAALAIVLAADWTAVIDFDVPADTSGLINILTLARSDWPDTIDFGHTVEITRAASGGFNNQGMVREEVDSGYTRSIGDGVARTEGHHKIATTRTPSRVAISVDGDAVVNDETDETAAINADSATFGGFTLAFLDNEVTIRSLTLFAAQADGALPGLSAL